MKLSSPAFQDSQSIPAEYACDGRNISPPLEIDAVPAGAKSLALIMDDPDAPHGTFVHWVVWNLPIFTTEISAGVLLESPCQGTTDFGLTGYGGPCPPSGTHRYFFKLYALDIMLDLAPGSSKSDLEKALEGHVQAYAQLMGTYQRRV